MTAQPGRRPYRYQLFGSSLLRITYEKNPNPSPLDTRKKAQDLMNEAENTPHTVTMGSSEKIAAYSASILAFEKARLSDGRVTGPNLTVEAASVTRGRSRVSLYLGAAEDWRIGHATHEAATRGQELPFAQEMRAAAFATLEDAADRANRWLDALDAWFAATEAATKAAKELLGV